MAPSAAPTETYDTDFAAEHSGKVLHMPAFVGGSLDFT
jgi:hypothetical protein